MSSGFDEARRLALVAKEAMRLELGLDGPARAPKRALPASRSPAAKRELLLPTRRSSRRASLRATAALTGADAPDSGSEEEPAYEPGADSPRAPPRVPSAAEARAIAAESAAREAPAGTLRSRELQLAYLDASWLGRLVPNFGQGFKASAVTLAACGAEASSGRALVRFGKYSGIQELSDAVVLFVNVGGDSYANMFRPVERGSDAEAPTIVLADGAAKAPGPAPKGYAGKDVALSWFARPRDKPESPVIARLTHGFLAREPGAAGAAPEGEADGDGAAVPVGLFMRDTRDTRPGGRSSDPLYVWCGQLELRSADFAASPMRFEWRLRESASLLGSEPFCQLLRK